MLAWSALDSRGPEGGGAGTGSAAGLGLDAGTEGGCGGCGGFGGEGAAAAVAAFAAALASALAAASAKSLAKASNEYWASQMVEPLTCRPCVMDGQGRIMSSSTVECHVEHAYEK